MPSRADLHRAIAATLASKRLGQPVFVRYLLVGLDKPEAVVPRLAQAAAVVRDWVAQPLDRIHAVGSGDSGQVALTLLFRQGATALVCFCRGQPAGLGVDVMVLGNHGAVYYADGECREWGAEGGNEPTAPAAQPLEAVITAALRSGKPEAVGEGDRP
jgi:hypothetical protein